MSFFGLRRAFRRRAAGETDDETVMIESWIRIGGRANISA